jgi:hypothetical protein
MEGEPPLPQTRWLGFRERPSPRPQAILGQAILRKYIRPKAQELGVEKRSDGTPSYTLTRLS